MSGDKFNIDDYVKTTDGEKSIDVARLKERIRSRGPLASSRKGYPYEIRINFCPCACDDATCDSDLLVVERRCGLSVMHWVLPPEELETFQDLQQFYDSVLAFGLMDSSAERQEMEVAIERTLEMHFMQVEDVACFCTECAERIGHDGLWTQLVLRNVAFNLQTREEIIKVARSIDMGADQSTDRSIEGLVEESFELGYATARLYAERQLREKFESPALEGMKLQRDKAKRALAAGKASADKRRLRIESLLQAIEAICLRSPDVARLAPTVIGELALGDAVNNEPNLWRQGKGQLQEYLDELSVDHRYQGRYRRALRQKPL